VKGTPLPNKQIWFRARPEAMEILKAAGVDGVTVANNHILDYDTDNFLETLDALQQNGIKYVGGGKNIAEARKPLVLEAKGVKIAFLGYSQFADLFFDWNYARSFEATDTLAGVPRIQEDWLAEDIKAAKALAPVVAVAYHWGDEFQNYPNEEQKRIAHLSIDLGADLVLGYHPHAIQGFELYKGKVIAYSTGNFIMDRQDTDLARESMLLDFTVAKSGVRSLHVLPVWIKAEQPYIMTGAEGESLLQKMRTISGWK
ncbi:MAG TPA: CapA family protein, partial [Symbiobacteriaceae bacterium]|nr:CapA family protein [Symbiobacteriaceae bacterium]